MMHQCLVAALCISALLCCQADDLTLNHQVLVQFLSPTDRAFDYAFDRFVEDTLHDLHVPGLSIAVVDSGKIASKGYGYASLPDNNATADTLYYTGSTTKAFTAAAAAALLVHNDDYPDIDWRTPISELIRSDFVLENEYATTHTTLEDALSHRSGLPRHDLMYGQLNDTPSAVVQRMRYLPLTVEPRVSWQYCNVMYAVVTDVLETVLGQSMQDILHNHFWQPLGMASTTFTIRHDNKRDRLARGYWYDDRDSSSKKGDYVPEPYIDILPVSGAGATISTVNDYALWLKAWLDVANDKTPDNSSSPLNFEMFRDLTTPRSIMNTFMDVEAQPALYALGWATADVLGEKVVAHNGGLTGFGTEIYLLPNLHYGIVTMGNTAGTSNEAGARIAARLLQEKLSGNLRTSRTNTILHSLLTLQQATTPCKSITSLQSVWAEAERIPLPRPIDHFEGSYSHPAYGTIDLTIVHSGDITSSTTPSGVVLEGLFYPRTWPEKIQLIHKTSTFFTAMRSDPHGLGDVTTGEGILWDNYWNASAAFELSLNGETVERLGLELEHSQVSMALGKGERYWREAMIWFDRL